MKWSDLLCDTYVLKRGRTYCPYRVCSELIVNESGGTVKKSKCPNCSKDFCFQCGVEWYAGYRCDEIEGTRDMNDVLLRQPAKNKKLWSLC